MSRRAEVRAARERTVVVVVGACGGCGASMIAGALALAWARDDARVWLMELDLERGDRGGAWDLPVERTLDDLAVVADELDTGHLRRAVHVHPSGVRVVLAGGGPTTTMWSTTDVGRLLDAAEGDDDAETRLIVDTGPGWSLAAGLATERPLSVLLASPPTLSGARRARRLLGLLGVSGADSRCGLVINHGPGAEEIGARAFGRAVGAPVLAELPWEEREGVHLSAGRWPEGRRARLGHAVAHLARAVT